MLEQFEKMTGRELREKADNQSPLPLPANLSIGLEASACSISNNLVRQRDVALIDAVSDRVGHDEWMVADLRNRLIFAEQDGLTTVMLDGEPIAQFGRPEFEVVDEGQQKVFKGKQRFWRVKR